MANTRISMAEAYDNKDVIQQILLMKDTVRNGTYADLNVERGTGADIGKIVFDFTLTSGEHQIFKVDDKAIASTSAAQVGTTVTVTVTYNDGTTDTFTFSTLIGAMTLDTAQTATAKKTFSAGIAASGIETTGDISVGNDAAVTGDLAVGGDAVVDGQMQIGHNLAIEDSSSDSVLSSAGAIKLPAEHVEAGSRAYASAGSSDVLVKSHVAEMPVAHLTGNETIAGDKTFSNVLRTSNYPMYSLKNSYTNIGSGKWRKLYSWSADSVANDIVVMIHARAEHITAIFTASGTTANGWIYRETLSNALDNYVKLVRQTDGKIVLMCSMQRVTAHVLMSGVSNSTASMQVTIEDVSVDYDEPIVGAEYAWVKNVTTH